MKLISTTWIMVVLIEFCVCNEKLFLTVSGLTSFMDVETPPSAYYSESSRGETWKLVMSDEFNTPGRDFRAGKDSLWTALEMPDGVNSALEYYSINMTSTKKDSTGRGYFEIKTELDDIQFRVYNIYARPPKYERQRMYYRSGAIQSWNKFCMQGGKIEVSAQLPGVTKSKLNPDHADWHGRVADKDFYPTWPGIWLMGNLGRALFSKSTTKMWPWSYSECNSDLSFSQRISACNSKPGHGLNPNQGRGAPEIDIIEGGGSEISVSIQLAPGMPTKYRRFAPDNNIERGRAAYCMYGETCKTLGANAPDVPTKYYRDRRRYRSWYQGLRYAPNTWCTPSSKYAQTYKEVKAAVIAGIQENQCKANTCPASGDVNGDFSLIDGRGPQHWNINYDGSCMPNINGYVGTFLCDPDNEDSRCVLPRAKNVKPIELIEPFEYQMDAISANYPIQARAYTNFLEYEVEWVPGNNGYIRWALNDVVLYEIPAAALVNPPQDQHNDNYRKLMIEEPMYFIFNTALSTSWGVLPPNPGKKCHGNKNDKKNTAICDAFPLAMKIDYIRVWQHKDMAIGCDPVSHPTRQFINDHIDEYGDEDNAVIEVAGGSNCKTNDDCTRKPADGLNIRTGKCVNSKCVCFSPKLWSGPRCILPRGTGSSSINDTGPSFTVALFVAIISLLLTLGTAFHDNDKNKRRSTINSSLDGMCAQDYVKMNNWSK